jgi:hypothetical protein
MDSLRRAVVTIVTALAAVAWAAECVAQTYRPERPLARDYGPGLTINFSPAAVDALNAGFDEDLRALDAFAKKRGIDRLPSAAQLHGEWKLYGRFYLVNFQHKLDDEEARTRWTWRRSGPRVPGARVYIMMHREF